MGVAPWTNGSFRSSRRALSAVTSAQQELAVAQHEKGILAGKTVHLVIGYAAGTGNDILGRLVTRHLGKHVPGNPTVVPQNMPGAGSYKAGNYLYSAAPRDGTAIGLISQTAATEELLGNSAVRFKAAEFGWIGRIGSYNVVSFAWHTSKARTIYDALKFEISIGASGAGSSLFIYPNMTNKLLGTKFKIVSGYQGTPQSFLAMERGEIDAASSGWITIKSTKQDWLKSRAINILVQYMDGRHPDLPDVPSVTELANTEEQRQILRLFTNEAELGKALFVPPGVPTETVAMLRRAFDAMAADPEYVADAEKIRVDHDALPGQQVQKLIEGLGKISARRRGARQELAAISDR